jgi:hypothetical protein
MCFCMILNNNTLFIVITNYETIIDLKKSWIVRFEEIHFLIVKLITITVQKAHKEMYLSFVL